MAIAALILLLIGGAILTLWILLRRPDIKEEVGKNRGRVDSDHMLIESGEREEATQPFSDDLPPEVKK